MRVVMLLGLLVLVTVAPSESVPRKSSQHRLLPGFLKQDRVTNTSHPVIGSVVLPAFLAHMAADCDCHFKGLCTCEASLEFMNCITAACSSGICACNDNQHFMWACGNMSATCPSVGLQCSLEGEAHCDLPPTAGIPPTIPRQQALPQGESTPTKAKQGWKEWLSANNLMARAVALFVQLIPFLIAAIIYNIFRKDMFVKDTPLRMSGEKLDFDHGLCSCFGNWKICLLSYCCTPLRWADTMDKAKDRARSKGTTMFMGYWIAVLVSIVLTAFSPLMGGITSFVLLIMCTRMRQELRQLYSIKSGGITILEDCCTYMWCQCCAVAQEARQIESVEA